MTTTTYRTCPRSGLQFESQAEKLMIVNAVTAVVALLVGGILAIGVVLTRWPAVHLLPADLFYLALTAHGIDMLIFWIIFFEMAILYFCSSTLLRCRLATPRKVFRGSHDDQADASQPPGDERGIGEPTAPDGDIDALLDQIEHLIAEGELHFQRGVLALQPCDQGHHQAQSDRL